MNLFSPQQHNLLDFSKSLSPDFYSLLRSKYPIMSHHHDVIVLSETSKHLYCHCSKQGNFYIEKDWRFEWFLQLSDQERSNQMFKSSLFN